MSWITKQAPSTRDDAAEVMVSHSILLVWNGQIVESFRLELVQPGVRGSGLQMLAVNVNTGLVNPGPPFKVNKVNKV